MSRSWEYANFVQKVHEHGGPAAYDRAIRQNAFNAGYLSGKSEGRQEGALFMLPFVVASCGYLVFDKWPELSFKFKCWKQQVTRRRFLEEEKSSKGKRLNLQPVCPNCGKKASGIDEVIKLFGFDRTEDGRLTQREVCRECWEMLNNEE